MAAVLKKRALAQFSQVIQEEPKPKKLRLVKRAVPSAPPSELEVLALERCNTSNEALQVLIKISDALPTQADEISTTSKKLCEHFHREKETAVRVKILALLRELGVAPDADLKYIIEEMCGLLQKEKSHKVLAQGISSLLQLGKAVKDDVRIHQKLVHLAKEYLTDTEHQVKCKSLKLIGHFLPTSGQSEFTTSVLKLVGKYTHSQDPRVRTAAFSSMLVLHERGLKLDVSVYDEVCEALKDDYESVRQVGLELLFVLSQTYTEHCITIADCTQEIRLVDDAFGKVCSMINDLSLKVRVLAAQLLGNMKQVSQWFLEQTLDKKLMSNMRRKRSAHERQRESVVSGEWATGKKWADDAPREFVDADSVSLITSGACGAFLHGLEDEFMEVRSATVDSVCALSINNPYFAALSLDFLVDMFNDEIEEVRLKAIDCLTKVSQHIVLREDQLETILGGLEDFSMDVREGLHKMLATCRLSTKECLRMCIDNLMDNMKRYPQDRRSIWCCMQKLGQKDPELTLSLVPELLQTHTFFDTPEKNVDDPAYISLLILAFNGAQTCPPLISLFQHTTLRHYYYLRDTLPQLVPVLKVPLGNKPVSEPIEPAKSNTEQFLKDILERLEHADKQAPAMRQEVLKMARRDLECVAEIEPALSPQAHFASIYITCHLLFVKAVSKKLWANTSLIAHQQGVGDTVKCWVDQLLQHCLKLQHTFIGLSMQEMSSVKQLKLRALALHLVFVVRGSNASALALCEHFVDQVENLQRFLLDQGLDADSFTEAVFYEMDRLDEPRPGAVARLLLPLLQAHSIPPLKISSQIKMTRATIYEPSGESDNPLKFTAGLVLGIPLDCNLTNIIDQQLVRVRVKYPDQQVQLVLPKKTDFRPGPDGTTRLLTTVLVSHQIWTEACHIEVGVVLDLTEPETNSNRKLVGKSEDLYTIELCPTVRVYVSPKPVKKGI